MDELQVVKLRCEYRANPLGLGVHCPRISWKLLAGSTERGIIQTAYQIQVTENDPTFLAPIWDSGRIYSDQSIHIDYGGKPVISRARYYYRVRVWDNTNRSSVWSVDHAYWEMGILSPQEWSADWITCDLAKHGRLPEACHMLRKKFELPVGVKKARIYATALGLYELEMNGHKIGNEYFNPGWTSYNNRLQTQTYDVLSHLLEGSNVVGIYLADGWYKGNLSWEYQRNVYGSERAALVQLHLTYEDGHEVIISSDNSWTAETGPIIYSEIYHGEIYDARLEKLGWSNPQYVDDSWLPVSILEHDKSMLVPQENEPTKIVGAEMMPIELIHTPSGETVLDFGQNMVGWVEITVKAAVGTEVILKHAEVLDSSGNFYMDNLRTAKQTNRYICKGEGIETWEPRFTFQGFRYVKVEGWPGPVSLDDFVGKVIHTDLESVGHFTCSDEMINQLQRNIVWGQKGNFLDVPTDCPQRNERLGWTGDAQMFIRTAAYNMNVAPFFTKWLRDLKADQLPDGGVPYVIPDSLPGLPHSSAAWGDAAVICPWTIYLCYGDERILEEQYESMKAWVDYIRMQSEDKGTLWLSGQHFGDWLALDANNNGYKGATPDDLIATAFYAYSAGLLAKTAAVLGRVVDKVAYSQLRQSIVESFGREYITPNGRLIANTQTANVLTLMFDLAEGEARERIKTRLAKLVEDAGNKLATGFVGTPYLCHVLTNSGYNDLAYGVVLTRDYPSWLYSVGKGATTIWEHWDSIKEDGSFWDPEMNSFNHYAYGSVGDWLYRVMAGIDTDEQQPGYKHVHIKPQPGPGIQYVNASLETMYGEIRSSWHRTEETMQVEVTIPVNTTATILLPGAREVEVMESEIGIAQVKGVYNYERVGGDLSCSLGSGVYIFKYKL